jgi:hypothetical protein
MYETTTNLKPKTCIKNPSKTKKGVANYVILRPLCTVAALVTDRLGDYGPGELSPYRAYPYLAFLTNCSQV